MPQPHSPARNSPEKPPSRFRATVHGTVFGDCAAGLPDLQPGDALRLVRDQAGASPRIWVHRADGTLLGHLPEEIEKWLAPWMAEGGSPSARVLRVAGPDVPSWRRLLVEISR